MSRPVDVDYLAEVLLKDPIGAAGRIVERRAARNGVPRVVSSVALPGEFISDSEWGREEVEARLSALREIFWSVEPSSVVKSLGNMDLEGFPDLARAADRLRAVNEARDEVDALEEGEVLDGDTLAGLRRILVAPSHDAAELRDELVRAQGRGQSGRATKGMVAAIRRTAPRLSALEEPWLERMRGARKEHKDSRVVRSGGGCFLIYLALSLGVRLIRALVDWIGS